MFTGQGELTICPRLVIFDRKANFGTLAASNALGEVDDVEDESGSESAPGPWTGGIVEYRQTRMAKSVYQNRMEDFKEQNEDLSLAEEELGGVRYWSDFNRVYYVPWSVQKLSNVAEWETPDGDWGVGMESFKSYDDDKGLMEGDVRLFVEECDSLQGAQTINDTVSFGGFMSGFLTAFRDDFSKLPLLVFPILSGAVSEEIDVDNTLSMKKRINDALYLRSLSELSSITVPLQPASLWSSGWDNSLAPHRNELYSQSAYLSCHIETSTLPLRLKETTEDLSSISAKLNWRGTTPFVNLGGVFPVSSEEFDLSRQFVNLSIPGPFKASPQYSRLDVTRGFIPSWISNYESSAAALWSLRDPYVSRFHAPTYPIPTSFPVHADRSGRPLGVNMLASLAASSDTGLLFKNHATFVDDCVRRRRLDLGIDLDELKELGNGLWTLYDNYSEGGDGAMFED